MDPNIPYPQQPKKKKPPACDRCKAKRVLCHPNPAGCPRCIEKGVECTTTPVVRRKPQKRSGGGSDGQRSRPSAPIPGSVFATPPDFEAANQPPERPASSSSSAAAPAIALPDPPLGTIDPVASTSQVPYSIPVQPLPELQAGSAFADLAAVQAQALTVQPRSSLAVTSAAAAQITPELAKHLFHCFEQTSFYDHTLFRGLLLRQSIFEPCNYMLDALPPIKRVLAYAVCTLGALFSFSPEIIGRPPAPSSSPSYTSTTSSPSSPSSPSADPTSFPDLEKRAAASPDLRPFGRRRAAQCAALRAQVEQLARVADLAFEQPPTVEGAAACLLLDALQVVDANASKTRPWLAAYMAHLRELIDHHELATDGSDADVLGNPTLWSIYLSADVVSEIDAGRLTSTYADQLALVGSDVPDAAKLDKDLREVVDRQVRDGVDRKLWPDIRPIAMLYLSTARELTEKILGTHARRNPSDLQPISSFLTTLTHFRRISSSFCRIVDGLLPPHERDLSLFPHAKPASSRGGANTLGRSGAAQQRYTRALALQGIRTFAVYVWTSLVIPFYRELARRKRALEDQEQERQFNAAAAAQAATLSEETSPAADRPATGTAPGLSSTYPAAAPAASGGPSPAGFEPPDEDALSRRQTLSQLSLHVTHAREFVRAALEAKVDGFDKAPNVATMATLRKVQAVDWAVVVAEEVEAGEWKMDEGLCRICERLSSLLKLAGYVHSSLPIDALILRLDNLALAYRLSQAQPPSHAQAQQAPQFAFLAQPTPNPADAFAVFSAGLSAAYPDAVPASLSEIDLDVSLPLPVPPSSVNLPASAPGAIFSVPAAASSFDPSTTSSIRPANLDLNLNLGLDLDYPHALSSLTPQPQPHPHSHRAPGAGAELDFPPSLLFPSGSMGMEGLELSSTAGLSNGQHHALVAQQRQAAAQAMGMAEWALW
ncbi:hypothetical protein JCM8097_002965 [Rhodosporidiobolus ruineniae]